MRKNAIAYDQLYALLRPAVWHKTVWEVATGTGQVAKHLLCSADHIEATDASAAMIAQAKRGDFSSKLYFSVQDMFHLPYADQSFDVVIVSNALHIVPHPEKALIEFRRVLKNDGTLIAPTFTHAENSPWGNLQALALKIAGFPLHSRWTSAAYLTFLQQNGWTVCKSVVLQNSIPLTYAECKKVERRLTMSFFENTRDPKGFGGRLMVTMMNLAHTPVALWGLHFLHLAPDAKVLDCGCGGGANIKRLLKRCPRGIVKGVDSSAVSVEKSRRLNAEAIQRDRCVIWQGSVQRIIFASDWFDAVTAFETVYFWPDLAKCFREVWRVLKPGGTFLICNEVNGDTDKDKKWTEIIDGMTIYKDTELKAYLEQAGFCDIAVHKSKTGWLCLTAVKRSDCGCGRQENEGL